MVNPAAVLLVIIQKYIVFDIPFRSKEEGDLLAKSILEERQMNFINAEATGLGNSQIKPGKVIELQPAERKSL